MGDFFLGGKEVKPTKSFKMYKLPNYKRVYICPKFHVKTYYEKEI